MNLLATNFDENGELAYFEGENKVWSFETHGSKGLCTGGGYTFISGIPNGQFTLYSFEGKGDGMKLKSTLEVDEINTAFMNYSEKHNLLFSCSTESGYLTVVKVEDGNLLEVSQRFIPGGAEPSGCHQIILNEKEDMAIAVNIKQNEIFFYKIENAVLTEDFSIKITQKIPARDTFYGVVDGVLPRHVCFGLTEDILYVISECSNEVFTIDLKTREIVDVQKIVLQEKEGGTGATMAIDKVDKVLYATMRMNNEFTVFNIAEDGKLTREGVYTTHGDRAPNVLLSADRKYLVFPNILSCDITVVDVKTKELAYKVPLTKALGIAEVL